MDIMLLMILTLGYIWCILVLMSLMEAMVLLQCRYTSVKTFSYKVLKDVGMEVPKSVETRKHSNIMRNPLPTSSIFYGVTHVIIVAFHHPLFCCMDASLFLHFFHFHPYILQLLLYRGFHDVSLFSVSDLIEGFVALRFFVCLKLPHLRVCYS